MKRHIWAILLLLPFLSFSQEHSQDTSLWQEVDRLIRIRNYAETLPLLRDIKVSAKQRHDRGEWVRAVLAESNALRINRTDDSAFVHIQNHLSNHIRMAGPVERAILHNYYAQYLVANLHRGLSETTDPFLSSDHNGKLQIIDSLFRLSLQPQTQLVAEPIQNWAGMLEKAENSTLTPTLFHFLADRYLKFLPLQESETTNRRSELIATLERLNQSGEYRDATAYLMSYNLTIHAWNTEKMLPKLLEVIDRQESDYNAFLLFQIANAYASQKPEEALKYVARALEFYPRSPWINEVKNLQNSLRKTVLDIQHDTFAPSDRHTPIVLHYRNAHADSLYIRVYNTTPHPKSKQNYHVNYDSTHFDVTIDAPQVYEEHFAVQQFTDYRAHNTIYKLNPLPYGRYTILVSNNPAFKDDGLLLDVVQSEITITDLFISATFVHEPSSKSEHKAQLINRKTGKPYSKEKLQLYETSANEFPRLAETVHTDETGHFTHKRHPQTRNDLDDYALFIPGENQLIDLSELGYIPYIQESDNDDPDAFIEAQTLTDRAIYRPGQRIYFKTILYNVHSVLGHAIANKKLTLYLQDANRQNIDSLHLLTNDFGSVNGSFQLPQHSLAGRFTLIVQQENGKTLSNKYVRVEEYKRPTFKTSFDINKETYTREDTAIFVGTAETLSGVPLTDALVSYKIDFYSPRQWRTVTLSDSTTRVDADGKYYLRVPLMDTIFDGMDEFTLRYSAEVVNQTGEMQAASGSYRFATKPWRIALDTKTSVEEYRWSEVHVTTQNQNGQPLKFAGKLHIYKYDLEAKTPLTAENERLFRQAEHHLLSPSEYEAYFPHYFDPVLLHKERPKTLVATYEFGSGDTTLVRLDSTLFDRGQYLVEAVSVQQGDTIRSTTEVDVFNADTRKVTDTELLVYQLDQDQYDVGDEVIIRFETDVHHAKQLLLFETQGNERTAARLLTIRKGKAEHRFTLRKEHLQPPTQFTALLLVDNKLQLQTVHLPIHRQDKKLTIKQTTFRDKITPGQKEKWSFTILQKDQAVATEVLATLYDAALDVFVANAFPATLPWSHRFGYTPPPYNYLPAQFNQTNQSMPVFDQHEWYKPRGNRLSRPYNYGLFANEGQFFGYPGVIEEVAVAGMGEVRNVTFARGDKAADLFIRGVAPEAANAKQAGDPLIIIDGEVADRATLEALAPDAIASMEALQADAATAIYGARAASGAIVLTTKEGLQKQAQLDAVEARTDLRETAFFYPELYTDAAGNVSFEFDSPEALSRWKLLLFAHGKNLESGAATLFTQTQKQLMLRPNLPRYLREGDRIVLRAQVQNRSKTRQSGNARIVITDPKTNRAITSLFVSGKATGSFDVAAENNSIVEWTLDVPSGHPVVHIEIVAASDEFADGERHDLPILPNKILVSDSEKIILRPGEAKAYQLHASGKENTFARVQVQTNPILEILSALDYLKNYPYESTEQTVSKWFALQMARHIQKNYPAIARYFAALNQDSTTSRLEQNTALSQLTKEEMPWLRDIQNEAARQVAIAKLFAGDIPAQITALERKLTGSQLPTGEYPWFDGGKADTYISIRILEVVGKALHLDPQSLSPAMRTSMQRLAQALDQNSELFGSKRQPTQVLSYLYARHYWHVLYPVDPAESQKLNSELLRSPEITARGAAGLAAKAWVVNQLFGEAKQAGEIKKRITQEVIHDPERGMYWESNQKLFNPISLHSYLIEAYKFHDPSKLYEISQWIYYSKQANHWRSTWATVDAIYALLLANEPKDFSLENTIQIWVDQDLAPTKTVVLGQSTWDFGAEELQKDCNITVQNNNSRRVFGSVVHHYFAPLEEVASDTKSLSVHKQYLVERNGEWVESQRLTLGEKVKVRLTLINDQALEYVHLKDARPSTFEPIYRPSGYQWWLGGYYFTSKDASTNYFFDFLPKGTRVLEYEVKVNNIGTFQSGISTVECLYDPAVRARSSSATVTVTER